MKSFLSLVLVVIVCGCSAAENKPDSGFIIGGGGGATGGGSGGGSAVTSFNTTGDWRLSLSMYYRDPVLLDGGMGRSISPAADGGGLTVEVQHPVTFRADDAGGFGIALTLVDGGACCADGPHFKVDGGALVFPAQRYRFPPGVMVTIPGVSPLTTPWVLDVHDLESRAAVEVSGVVNFPVVKVETTEDGNPQNAAYEHSISFTRQ